MDKGLYPYLASVLVAIISLGATIFATRSKNNAEFSIEDRRRFYADRNAFTAEVKAELEKMQFKNVGLEVEIEKLKQEMSLVKRDSMKLELQVIRLKDDNERLKMHEDEHKILIRLLEAEVGELKKENVRLTAENVVLRDEVDVLKERSNNGHAS